MTGFVYNNSKSVTYFNQHAVIIEHAEILELMTNGINVIAAPPVIPTKAGIHL